MIIQQVVVKTIIFDCIEDNLDADDKKWIFYLVDISFNDDGFKYFDNYYIRFNCHLLKLFLLNYKKNINKKF